METVIIYKIFYFFEGIYFWKPLNFECLISEYIANVTPKVIY